MVQKIHIQICCCNNNDIKTFGATILIVLQWILFLGIFVPTNLHSSIAHPMSSSNATQLYIYHYQFTIHPCSIELAVIYLMFPDVSFSYFLLLNHSIATQSTKDSVQINTLHSTYLLHLDPVLCNKNLPLGFRFLFFIVFESLVGRGM